MSTTTRRAGKPTLNLTHPNLAAQVHPDSPVQAHEVTAGSSKKPLLWVCEEGHTWETTVVHRVNGRGCRACYYSKPHPNKKTLNLTHPELAKQIHPNSPIKAHEVTYGSAKKPLWVCPLGHTWYRAVTERAAGYGGCPTCREFTPIVKSLAATHPHLAKQIHPDSPLQAHEVTAGSSKKPLWVCDEGHTWETTVANRVNGNACRTCHYSKPRPNKKTLNLTHPELAKQIHSDSPIKANEVTAGSAKEPLWVCSLGHTWRVAVFSRTAGYGGCPQCREFTPLVKSLVATHPHLAAQIHPDSPIHGHEVTYGSKKKTLWACDEGHTWEATVGNRVNGNGCPHCLASQGERDVRDYLTTLLPAGMQVVANTRKIIPPLELDIYVPELNLAVEYNGTYWHSNEVILAKRGITADEYHNNKQRRCEEQGVTLIFVDEHDWMAKPEQVKQHLKTVVNTALTNTKTPVW